MARKRSPGRVDRLSRLICRAGCFIQPAPEPAKIFVLITSRSSSTVNSGIGFLLRLERPCPRSCTGLKPFNGFTRDFTVVEMIFLCADNLIILMPFAGNQYHVAGTSLSHC